MEEGAGFKISQMRLGPGRIHHCMRTIGFAEKAQELMIKRTSERTTFGQKIITHQAIQNELADNRIKIDAARLLVLNAAAMIDKHGSAKFARKEIAMIKIHVPEIALVVIDRAIQAHGGLGVSQDTPLARMYAGIRTLQIADGPSVVHARTVGKLEVKSQHPYLSKL